MIGTGTEDSAWHLSRDGFMSVSPRPTSDFDVGFTVVWQLLNLFCLTAFCANYLSDCHSMRDRLGPQIQVLMPERVLYNRSLYIAVTAPGVAEMLSSAQFSIVQNFWGGSFLPQERGVYIISEYSKWLWNGRKTDKYLRPGFVQINTWHKPYIMCLSCGYVQFDNFVIHCGKHIFMLVGQFIQIRVSTSCLLFSHSC